MLRRLLLWNVGYIVGVVIEAVLTIAAVILIILVIKYGLPRYEERERKVRQEKRSRPLPEEYILKYVAGEGSGESPALEQYKRGAKILLKSNMFTTPQGKKFEGWSDGEKKYQANQRFVMPDQAVTLTAQWSEAQAKYALRYVAGEGSVEEATVESYYKGEKVVLKSNMFVTPQGKRFEGWSDGENKYSSRFNYTMPAQSVTLTAQWSEIYKEERKTEVEGQGQRKKEVSQREQEVQEEGAPTQQVEGVASSDGRPIVVNVYAPKSAEKTIEKEVIHTVEKGEEDEPEEDNMFANYTILELYGLLTDEQKRYFDAIKEAALGKPQAKLTAARNYLNIKIGKRSIVKLRIRRLVTVGEYTLENDILKDFRKSSENKAGNAKIKVRPTLVAVTDEATLETALSMIDLVHKQILES